MALVVEPRHRIVGLWGKLRAGNAAGRQRLEDGKAPTASQRMNECGNEHGLARARQSGHAETDRRLEQRRRELGEGTPSEPDLLKEFKHGGLLREG